MGGRVLVGKGTGRSVFVLPDGETLALAVATAVVAEARSALKRSGCFAMALSGGSTPRRTYELLAQHPFADDLPWASTHVFWGDERCVNPGDPSSNERMAHEALLDRVPVPDGQVHPMRCPGSMGPGGSEERDLSLLACRSAYDYESLLRSLPSPGLDLVLLGLGVDGHTASLFPGPGLGEECGRWVVPAFQGPRPTNVGGDGGCPWRVTLTAPFINMSAAVFFLVAGAAKAPVVREVIGGRGDPHDLPARMIDPPGGRLCWFLDEDAASLLDEEEDDDATTPV